MKKFILIALFTLGMFCSSQLAIVKYVYADEETVLPPWSLDSTGVLHIQAGKLNMASSNPLDTSPWSEVKGEIVKIIFEGKVTGSYELSFLFSGLNKLVSIENLNNLDVSNVTYLDDMFSGDTSLTNLDLSSFNTKNVVNMRDMFLGDTSLTSLDLSSFNTSAVRDMAYMFSQDNSLKTLYLSDFSTATMEELSGVDKDMAVYHMFDGTKNLSSIKLGPSISFAAFKSDDYELNLTDPIANDIYTGEWINSKGQTLHSLKDYEGVGGDGSDVWSGMWTWQKK